MIQRRMLCSIWMSSKLVLILPIFCSISMIVTQTESSSDYTPLVRPRPEHLSSNGVPMTSKTECTPENPICSNVANYPDQLINQIMDRQKDRYSEVFGTDVVIKSGDKLAQRVDVDEDGNLFESLCDSDEKLHYPRSGFNMHNKSVLIVNTKEYMQGVRIETCRNQHKPCDKLKSMITNTACKQFFHYRTLLAVVPETNKTYKEQIILPSCCKCVILR